MAEAEPFATAQLYVVEWAAKECTRQMSGEASVWWMCRGWQYAMDKAAAGLLPDEAAILDLGALVEPIKNRRGYRRCGIRVGHDVKGPWEEVPRQMAFLVDTLGDPRYQQDMGPTEWFRAYEEIHPFLDGNGRTGSILWNWLSGTLAEPVDAPDLWDMPRQHMAYWDRHVD